MINAIIIDDEKSCRDLLSSLLQVCCTQVKVIEQCESVASAIKAIHRYHPDLIFLDVEMPDGTGFDLLHQVNELKFDVIFVSGFDQYAVKAFKFSAIDYLMKPVISDELTQAIKRFEMKSGKIDPGEQLNLLLANIKNSAKGIHKIAVPSSDGLIVLDINDISHLEADGNYSVFYSSKGKHVVSKSLKEYDELLFENNFLRVHQSHLINLNFVKKYVRGEGGYIVLHDDTSIPVSVRKKQEVLEKLALF